MNSKPPLLKVLMISVALLLGALLGGGTAAEARGKKCPRGKVGWNLDGRSVCLTGSLPGKPGAQPAMAGLWLREASRSAPGGGLRLSPALRRALPRAGTVLAREIGEASSGAGASATGRGPAVERVDHVVGREQMGGGVVAEGRIRGRVFEDESSDLQIEFELRDRGGNSVLYSPDFSSLFDQEDEVGCPTAEGLVSTEVKGQMGGTVIQMKDRRVLASKTASHSWRIRARGRVGTDARLYSVAADIAMTLKNYERGMQEETSLTAGATLARQGGPRVAGAPTASVKVRAAGYTRAEERRYEAEAARALAGSPELATAMAGAAVASRKRLLGAEQGWYAIPNDCAQLLWTPGASSELETGETRQVSAVVVAKRDGGQATGAIALGAVGRGRFAAQGPSFSPGSPAGFLATGGEPDSGGLSVSADAIATSTAGRAASTWFARATPVELPARFVGPIASTSSTAGLTRHFAGSATYTRTSVVRGPDGSVTGWYELTAAALDSAKETLGPTTGCRYEATGTGGNVEAGDLELRVLPSGEVLYALLYDLRLPAPYLPTIECPPEQPVLDGEISAFLNTRRPGPVEGQLRPAGPGFELIGSGVQDVTAEAGVATTASWTLMPG